MRDFIPVSLKTDSNAREFNEIWKLVCESFVYVCLSFVCLCEKQTPKTFCMLSSLLDVQHISF